MLLCYSGHSFRSRLHLSTVMERLKFEERVVFSVSGLQSSLDCSRLKDRTSEAIEIPHNELQFWHLPTGGEAAFAVEVVRSGATMESC